MIVIACMLLGWHVNMSVCMPCCCVWVWIYDFQCEFIICAYFTFFPSSVAFASLVSTLVWSTMLSVAKQRRQKKGKEKEEKKKVVDKIRVSDNAPAHVWVWKHRTLQSGTCCAHTYIHKQMRTHRASIRSVSLFFSLITLLKVKIREKIVEASHYNRMPSVACCFYTSLPFKPLIHTPLSDCVCMCGRGGSTLISLRAKYISHYFISNSYIQKWKPI